MIKDPYFDIKSISNSDLKHFKRSPEHYYHYKKFGMDRTKAMIFGSALHCYVLEYDKFKDQYIVMDTANRPDKKHGMTAKENKDWELRLHIMSGEKDMEVIDSEDVLLIKLMADKLYSNPVSKELLEFTRNKYEQVYEWKRDGIKCKCKTDISNDEFIADLKSAQSADIRDFTYQVFKMDYYRQGAMYIEGSSGGNIKYTDRKDFYFIAVEKVEPFGVAVYKLTPDVIEHGINEYRRLVKEVAACWKSDIWESYQYKAKLGNKGIHDIDLPFYLED